MSHGFRLPLLLALLLMAGVPSFAQGMPPRKAWTLLFYDDADFPGGFDPFEDLRATFAETPDVNVLVLRDRYEGPACLYRVDGSHQAVVLKDLGEVDMGSADTLRAFTTYAKEHFPSERTLVAFYNHGGGWAGACEDATSGRTLSMDALRRGLAPLGSVDLLCFTAPCLMGSLEAVYEVRDVARCYVGSENRSGFALWEDALPWLMATLKARPGTPTEDLARGLVAEVASHVRRVQRMFEPTFTLSAVRPGLAPTLVRRLNALAGALQQDGREKARRTLDRALPLTRSYAEGCSTDLGELLRRLEATDPRPSVQRLAREAQAAYQAMLLAEDHGSRMGGSSGLTVHFAKDSPFTAKYLAEAGLDFLEDCGFPALLRAYCGLPPRPRKAAVPPR